VQRGLIAAIIARFENKGFKLVALKMLWPTKEKAESHYADLATKPFFKVRRRFLVSARVKKASFVSFTRHGHPPAVALTPHLSAL
jgi:nucleoside diphosphate kinase